MKKILFFIIPLTFWAFSVQAGAGDNVSGFAWSENIGWISFNNTSGGGAISYGVNINPSDGKFSGYAWSENIGWINFAPAGPYPNPPNHSVEVNLNNLEVSGWARAVSYGGGWDGWIKMRCQGGECNKWSNSEGVSINGSGQFQGYAWGSDVVGWIHFSGSNYGAVTNASIFNSPPAKPGISSEYSPDGVSWNNCTFQEKSTPTFHWTYSDSDGDPQAAYEIEVNNNAGKNADGSFQVPKFNNLVNLASTAYILNLSDDDEDPDYLPFSMQDYQLDWDTQYFWQVQVQDNQGNWSDWSNSIQFKTPKHAYPWVDFTWSPLEPSQGETASFNPNASLTYGGSSISSYLWSVTQGTGVFVDSTSDVSRYPHIQFSTADNKVSLRITDNDDFSCSKKKDVSAQLPLPEYKEISPIIWLRKILAGIF